jgi:hypothetical protein
MTALSLTLSRAEMELLISAEIASKLDPKELKVFKHFVSMTTVMWAGFYRHQVKAVWGLIPPVMAADSAYLWLHVIEHVEDCEFLFVRHSQRAVQEALKRFPTIIGHCLVADERAQRWLRWLGAEFEPPTTKAVQFTIRAKHEPAIAS